MTMQTTKPFTITPVYDLLLRGSTDMPVGLYHLHQATAEQLTRLHYKDGMLKTVGKRLKVLVDKGFIQADCIPTKLFKSPYYYTLDSKGMRYLESIGLDADASFRASKEVSESYLHLRHALELNDVYIAALRLRSATDNRVYISRYIHERTFKSLASTKHSPLVVTVDGSTLRLVPDGFLDIRQRRPSLPDMPLPLLIEHDRGTEQQEHFRRRLRVYKALLSSGTLKQVLNTAGITVAFTTFISTKRRMQMREWTKAELQNEPHLANTFIFAELPRPLEPRHLLFEPRWYTVTNEQPIALLGE